jgi:hypothetical protein
MIRTNGCRRAVPFQHVERETQNLALLLARHEQPARPESQVRTRLTQLRRDLGRHYAQLEKEQPLQELVTQAMFLVGPVRRFRREQCKVLGELRHMALAETAINGGGVEKLLRLLATIRELQARRQRLELAVMVDEPAAGD